MNVRTLPALFSALLAGAALLGPLPSAESSSKGSAPLEEKLFFAMQIADEEGTLLAEPKLLGMCGVPLEMTLADRGKGIEPRMSLRLESEPNQDGSFQVDFELSVKGKVSRGRGSMTLRFGEEKSAYLSYPGGHLEVQLVAFAVPSAELDLYLEHGIRRLEKTWQT